MEYKKDLFGTENIPEFAMQPAKPAEEFDPTVYDKLYAAMTKPAEESPKEDENIKATDATPEPEPGPVIEPEISVSEQEQVLEPEIMPVPEQEQVLEPEITPVPEKEPEPIQESEDVVLVSSEVSEVEDEEVIYNQEEDNPVFMKEKSVAKDDLAPVVATKAPSVKIEPAGGDLINRTLNYTEFKNLSPAVIHMEEDVLVPDVKPDLEDILCVEGKCRLAERSVSTGSSGIQVMRIAGDVTVQTLYIAENGQSMMSVETRLPFREDCPVNVQPNGNLYLSPKLVELEHEKINERKFRVKATIKVYLREYRTQEVSLLTGLKNDKVEFLEDKMRLTDVALRRTETMEIEEELRLKEGAPEIDKILCYNVNVVENHKQVSSEKAVVNASVYCNIVYQSDRPVFYQGKTEFTQFIKMDGDSSFDRPLTGGKATFQVTNLSILPKKDDNGDSKLFDLNMDVDTTIEYYRELEEPVVTDLYHYTKDVNYDTQDLEHMTFCGNGVSEATVREIINVPERYGTNSHVVYLTGSPIIGREFIEQGKCVVEGTIPLKIVCVSEDEMNTPFCMHQDLDFRASMDIPGSQADMDTDSQIVLKELWHDQINSRQIEVNASIGVATNVFGKSRKELIQTVSFIEHEGPAKQKPAMVVYIAKDGDDAWKVAKKYRTSTEQIREINGLTEDSKIKGGTKLLIIQ